MMPAWLLLRLSWRNLWRQKKRTAATLGAITFSVTMILASISLQQGMIQRMFELMVVRQTGHLQVHEPTFPQVHSLYALIPGAQTLASRIRNLPEVAVATVRTYAFGLIANQEESLGVQLLGLDLEHEETFGNWSDRIVDGSLLSGQMDDSILIGETAAHRLSIHAGDDVVIMAQAADGSLANRLFRVKGLYRSGISSLDERTVVFSQSHLQEFLALSNVGHEIAIQLHDDSETDRTAQRIKTLVPKAEHLLVRTWQEVSPTTGRLLGLQRVGTWIVVGVIFGVASLTILNTMLMSVLERVHEFGLLFALGLRPAQVVGLVSAETFFLTTLGATMGGIAGLPLHLWLARHGLRLGQESSFSMTGIYFDPVVYGRLTAGDFFSILPALYLLTAVTALWPSLHAARLTPMDALGRR